MIKDMSGVYCILNKQNNHIYIGSSKWCDRRWKQHHYELRNNKHHCHYLQHAWNKYGDDNFARLILEEVEPTKEKLVEREQFYLDQADKDGWTKYNHLPRAGSRLGSKMTEETKNKLALIHSTPEYRENMSNKLKGRKLSSEHREKVIKNLHSGAMLGKVAWNKGKKLSDEHRRKMSRAWKYEKHFTPEIRKKFSVRMTGNKICIGRIPWNKELS